MNNNHAAPTHGAWAYLPGLDGLRAIAVLAVFGYHANLAGAVGGFLGVESFFVISGYLITGLLVREYQTTGRIALGAFWLRRARRLWPALWLVLAASALLAWVWAPDALPRLKEDVPAAFLYVSNWVFIFRAIPYFEQFGRPPLLKHLWSLAVEEQFYLVWPLAGWAVLRAGAWPRMHKPRLALALALLLGAAGLALWMAVQYDPLGDPARLYYGTDTRAAGFLVGAALALLWTPGRPAGRAAGLVDLLGLGGLAGLLWSFTRVTEFDGFLYRGGFLLTAAATGLAILAAVRPDTRLARLLGGPALRWLGTRSYGFYLWHWPLIVISGWGVGAALPPGLLCGLQLTASLALAEMSYRWVEQPIRRLGFQAWGQGLAARWGGWPRTALALAGAGLAVGLVLLPPRPAATAQVLAGPAFIAAQPSATAQPTLTTPADAASPTSRPAAVVRPAHAWESPLLGEPAADQPDRPAPSATVLPTQAPPPTALPLQPTVPAALALPEPSTAPLEASAPPAPAGEPAALRATLIGDSIMATVLPWLEQRLDPQAYYVAAQVNRRMGDALALIPELAAHGRLAGTVLIHLGTNQPFDASVFDAVMQALVERGVTRVIVLNVKRPVAWEGVVNQQLADGVARWPQAALIDWNALGSAQPGWFIADQVHPNPAGAEAYAALIQQLLAEQP